MKTTISFFICLMLLASSSFAKNFTKADAELGCNIILSSSVADAYNEPTKYRTPIFDEVNDKKILTHFKEMKASREKNSSDLGNQVLEFAKFASPFFQTHFKDGYDICINFGLKRLETCGTGKDSMNCTKSLLERPEIKAMQSSLNAKITEKILRPK